jgi:hypothetical protein
VPAIDAAFSRIRDYRMRLAARGNGKSGESFHISLTARGIGLIGLSIDLTIYNASIKQRSDYADYDSGVHFDEPIDLSR